ncbi:ABC transport ATP-binding subunit [Salmonella enterica subsp. enterica]|uniref:ABC transport ATP-binding subunit n=1 Tax=Salmonella enterica I TaxID=59201 RepID=A0A3S4GKS2_SALET|nr:ABC transport ATP-binding subunit [Salmonella enterica subsp. enterica]
MIFCKWRCWSRNCASLMSRTPDWISMRLKIVAEGVNALRDNKRAFIIVTHYQRILDYIKPDYVHVLYQGRIVRSGDFTLVKQLEEQGYGWLTEQQ